MGKIKISKKIEFFLDLALFCSCFNIKIGENVKKNKLDEKKSS